MLGGEGTTTPSGSRAGPPDEQAAASMADEPWDGDGEAHLTGRASEEAEADAGGMAAAREVPEEMMRAAWRRERGE